MPKNWRTEPKQPPSLKPPIPAGDARPCPEPGDRSSPEWDMDLKPDCNLGFSSAKGTIQLVPPEY